VEKPEGRRLLGKVNLDVNERIILKWILEKKDELVWTGLLWLRIGTS
jgi:hypothetical protein